jgi:TRAP-type C4-dicarboxylate transport system permease small subunit
VSLAARIDRAILAIARALAAVAAAAVAAMAALTVSAVVMRYGVGAPFRFTEELAGLMLVLAAFLAMPWVLATHANIRVTLVSDRLGGPWRRVAWVAGQAVLVAFVAIFFRDALADARFTQKLALKSEVARIPLAPFVWAMTGAVGLTAAIAAWQALRPPPPKRTGPHP